MRPGVYAAKPYTLSLHGEETRIFGRAGYLRAFTAPTLCQVAEFFPTECDFYLLCGWAKIAIFVQTDVLTDSAGPKGDRIADEEALV
jgi:1,6-anhydro-N-acetylmuramate kinase